MILRDMFVTFCVAISLPFILARPYVGILMWSWLAYMNPHRLAWGFARDLPVAAAVAAATLIGILFSREPKRIPWTRETVVLLIFIGWMLVSTLAAMYPDMAWPQWQKVWKVQLFTYLTLMLMADRQRLHWLVWVIALSLGFYGVKGGLWVLSTGGGERVLGPAGTFIGGNNEIGLALIMTVPLYRYLYLQAQQRWLRWGLIGASVLTLVAIAGTHSRGALIGVAAMLLFLLLKGRKRLVPLLLVVGLVLSLPSIMPAHWFTRMETIQTYEEDRSATERIRAWRNAFELALRHPLTGGGYDVLIRVGQRDAHSIYFEVLAEHGFVGLGLFLALALFTWGTASRVQRRCRGDPERQWASDLTAMVQVSMVGYATAGAFLGLAYFDLYYHLVAVVVLASHLTAPAPRGKQVRA